MAPLILLSSRELAFRRNGKKAESVAIEAGANWSESKRHILGDVATWGRTIGEAEAEKGRAPRKALSWFSSE